ncbi:hypothetical protein [Salinisphaera sp. G21_0]|uniref:hypothetical protein n=1 Tax=Salinisphaera sp. G21_0 TaxID=2821094 RepID=UPI001ADC90EA|nr:hypothetical protein [Salinisphaera sp. G21_0]MBO9484277.1 hypothetical protein [Salinisphaera sp. G21_0]
MNIPNCTTVTTQPAAHRLCDYTLDCERIKQDSCACGITTSIASAGGAALGGVIAYNTVSTISSTVGGVFLGMSVGACFSCAMGLCVNCCSDDCDYIKLRNREISTCTELAPLPVRQQQEQEPPSAEPPPYPGTGPSRTAPPPYPGTGPSRTAPPPYPGTGPSRTAPPPYPGTGSSRTAPVQSQPRLHSSSPLPSIDNFSSIHPYYSCTHAISQIVSGRSTSEVASGAYRLTSGSTSLGLPGFGFSLW